MKLIVNTDGGARGNPGPGALGVVLHDTKGSKIFEIGKYLGICTNNEAEYMGLITGLENALRRSADEVECFLDSELVVRQVTGKYKVKEPRMKVLWTKVKELEKKFKKVTYSSIPRSRNKEADALVNQVLDAQN